MGRSSFKRIAFGWTRKEPTSIQVLASKSRIGLACSTGACAGFFVSIFFLSYLQAFVTVLSEEIGLHARFSMYAVLTFQNTAFPKVSKTMAMTPTSKRQRSGSLNSDKSISRRTFAERTLESILCSPAIRLTHFFQEKRI